MAVIKGSYYVLYVKDCSPKVKKFNTKAAMNTFLKKFSDAHGGLDNGGDTWVNHIFYGKKLKLIVGPSDAKK